MAPAMEPMEQNRHHAKPGAGAADPSYRLLACQYVSAQLDALVGQIHGVRENKDTESVHQTRVASRRLRAALGMFAECFDSKKTAGWRRRLRRLTRGLGAARDLDVQIAYVQGSSRPGYERPSAPYQGDRASSACRLAGRTRDAAQTKFVAALDALNEGDTAGRHDGEGGESRSC